VASSQPTSKPWEISSACYPGIGAADGWRHDHKSSSVIEVGRRLLNDPDELIRVVGVEHLMQLGEGVIPTLQNVAVEDQSDLVRNRAVAALKEIEEST
jgi:hypothetical protein